MPIRCPGAAHMTAQTDMKCSGLFRRMAPSGENSNIGDKSDRKSEKC